MKRVLTALVAASLAIVGVLLLSSPLVLWVATALMTGCAVEYGALARHREPLPRGLLPAAVALLGLSWLVPAVASDPGLALALLAAGPLVFAVLHLVAVPQPAAGSLGWASFGLPYLVLPVWSLYELHDLDPGLLLVLLVSIWANDSVAFLVGTRWGRRKLAPRLSPGKTWEGAIGGLLGGGAVALAGLVWLGSQPRWPLLGLLVLAGVAGQLGDLVESMLKRTAGVKDSGTVVPGHGGLLDRLDAIILAAPVFYASLAASGLAIAR